MKIKSLHQNITKLSYNNDTGTHYFLIIFNKVFCIKIHLDFRLVTRWVFISCLHNVTNITNYNLHITFSKTFNFISETGFDDYFNYFIDLIKLLTILFIVLIDRTSTTIKCRFRTLTSKEPNKTERCWKLTVKLHRAVQRATTANNKSQMTPSSAVFGVLSVQSAQ